MVGSGAGILKRCIHTLLTLTRGHSTTLRDATLKPRTRSTWSLYSLYSLDALTLTPSSCSTGTACDKFENMYTLPSITTHQCALPSKLSNSVRDEHRDKAYPLGVFGFGVTRRSHIFGRQTVAHDSKNPRRAGDVRSTTRTKGLKYG